MATKPYDPTLKALVEIEPPSWPAFLGWPLGPTQAIDADIATVTGAADKVLRVAADPAYLLHLEFVSGHDAVVLPQKLLVRNALLADRHDLPVRSAVLLLRPQCDSRQLTGLYDRSFPNEESYLTFRYQVVRVWQMPPEPLLTGGLPMMALAPISAVTEAELPGIIKRMDQRLSGRRARKQAAGIWAATYVLLGLRYSREMAKQLFRGVHSMRDSSTYQAIMEDGRVEGAVAEARKLLRRAGDRLYGPADRPAATTIDGIDELARLEALFDLVPTAKSWQELLGLPAPRRRGGKPSS